MKTTTIVIIIVTGVTYLLIMPPIEKFLKKRIAGKWSLRLLNFPISFAIILSLFLLADQLLTNS